MATLAHSVSKVSFKIIIFVGLFILSTRLMNVYPHPMPEDYQHEMFMASQKLGVHNPENFYLSVELIANLIATLVEYTILMKFWRKIQRMRKHIIEP